MNTYGFTKKIALVGTGFVGMSFAYAMLCESVCDELVLIDVNKKKAEGEAMYSTVNGAAAAINDIEYLTNNGYTFQTVREV